MSISLNIRAVAKKQATAFLTHCEDCTTAKKESMQFLAYCETLAAARNGIDTELEHNLSNESCIETALKQTIDTDMLIVNDQLCIQATDVNILSNCRNCVKCNNTETILLQGIIDCKCECYN